MPLRISRTCLALATLSSPVSFLYQTQTLTAPLRYAKWNARQGRSLQSTSTAFTPESSPGRGEESVHDNESSENTTPPLNSDSPSQSLSNGGRKSFLKRRAATVSRSHPPAFTLESSPGRDEESVHDNESSENTTPPLDSDSPSQTLRNSYLKRRTVTVSQSHPPALRPVRKRPTMTRTEQKAFGGLLEQVGVGGKHDAKADTEEPEKPGLSKHDRNQISAIFNSVLEGLRKKNRRYEAPTEGAENRKRRTKVDKLQAGDSNPSELRSDYPDSVERAIKLTVERESAKIESALRAAIDEGKGDTGIWEVCKERIFSMLRYLGDSRLPKDSGTSPTSSAGEQTPHSSPLEVPESVPVEAVVTALYPKMLLVAFRLLNSHFPESPLISQFRSRIKARGRTSAVLGSSTGLYNELIYFHWRACGDLPSVVSLLKEMEITGVEPDQRTCGLLRVISEQRERDLEQLWKRTRRENRNRNQKRSSLRDSFWDMEPNQSAVMELFGEDGWLQRLEMRVQEIRKLRSSRLPADRFTL